MCPLDPMKEKWMSPIVFFFNVGRPKRTSFWDDTFWTPSKPYISVSFTHYNYKFMPLCGYCKVFVSMGGETLHNATMLKWWAVSVSPKLFPVTMSNPEL